MAIYSFSANVLSRSNNHHATAAAAYRSASVVCDQETGERHDYTRKRGVLYSEILTPENAPAWMHDRTELWNAVEAQENRADSQLARDVTVAIPHELDLEQGVALLRGFARDEFTSRGMVADMSIHAPSRDGDDRNTHAHIMLTLRPIDGDGFGRKAREWNSAVVLTHWREAWAEHCNAALEDGGYQARIDHRSLEAQGIERIPGEHQGKAATAQERRGIATERGDRQREVEAANHELDGLVAELAAVDARIAAAEERRLDAAYGSATPEIDAATARDLAARFGDPIETNAPQAEADHAERLREAQAGGAVPVDIVAHATADAALLPDDIATHATGNTTPMPADITANVSDLPPAPRGWRVRLQGMAENLADFLHDERSGGPREFPEYPEMEDGPQSWAQRVVAVGRDAAHRLWAALYNSDADAPHADPKRDPDSGRPWAELEAARDAERGGTERQTPSLPERPEAEPPSSELGDTRTAFDRLAQELLTEGFGQAAETLEHHLPEPEAPEPESPDWYGPEPGY